MKKISFIMLAIVAVLPNSLKLRYYRYFRSAKIHPTVKIGFSIIAAKKIVLEQNVRIGHFNIVMNLEEFVIGENSQINKCNVFNATPLGSTKHFTDEVDRNPSFYMGKESAIGSSHYFNCDNSITLGNLVGIAGRRSQFLTHGVNFDECKQKSAPIYIEDYARIATSCVVTKGIIFPFGSILGANSTLAKTYTEPYSLYSGVPAKYVKTYDKEAKYFKRGLGHGFVH